MANGDLNWIANYIWSIADDVLRDLYVRGLRSRASAGRLEADHLYGQEINAETYAICKADLLLKGEGSAADNIGGGAEHSTLSNDAFPAREFDFMLSNPPYGKSWKTDHRRGKVQLIDATQRFRPLRVEGADAGRVHRPAEVKALKESGGRSEGAPPIIRKVHGKDVEADPLRGHYSAVIEGKPVVVEYEPDPDLRDTEQVPIREHGGIDTFLRREVLPYAADAWYRPESVKTGYEISFTRHFHRPEPTRTLNEIRGDILALEHETRGLLEEILGTADQSEVA